MHVGRRHFLAAKRNFPLSFEAAATSDKLLLELKLVIYILEKNTRSLLFLDILLESTEKRYLYTYFIFSYNLFQRAYIAANLISTPTIKKHKAKECTDVEIKGT